MPALMRWPGRIRSGSVVRQPGAAIDILPTMLAWAGGRAPAGIDGMSAVGVGDWKLIVNPPSFAGEPERRPRREAQLGPRAAQNH